MLIFSIPILAVDISTCTNITSSGSYFLTSSIPNSAASVCINITVSDVSFNGQGFYIDGTDAASSVGISASNSTNALTNITIQNTNVTDWNNGIIYKNAPSGRIIDNRLFSNANYGLYVLSNSNYTTITNNSAPENGYGIVVHSSVYNTLVNNTANSNGNYGILLTSTANNNTLINNTANSNYYGIYVTSSSNNSFIDNEASSNIYYGILFRVSSVLNSVINNTFNSNDLFYGIYLFETSTQNVFINNTVNLNNHGIYLDNSTRNNFTNNTARNSEIWDYFSNSNSINNIVTNLDIGPIISFSAKDIAILNASSPAADPPYFRNISKFINATNQSADSWLYLNIRYLENEINGLWEDSLVVAKYDSLWRTIPSQFANTYGVDKINNYVYANITDFSTGRIFALLGQIPVNVSNCTNITEPGTYLLNQSIPNSGASVCINITAPDVTFDGQGFYIDGTDGANTVGISVSNSTSALSNVKVKNVNVTDWNNGVVYQNAPNGTIIDNRFFSNANYGLYVLSNSNYTAITNNSAPENGYGIVVHSSSYNTLVNNTANSNGNYGILVTSTADNNTLINNTANSNYFGIYVSASDNGSYIDNEASGNVYYGFILRSSSVLNSVINNTFNSNTGNAGIYLLETSNQNTFINNIVNSNKDGIWIQNSNYNNFSNHTARTNTNWSFLSDTNAINNRISNLDIGPIISFYGKDIGINNASSPAADPANFSNLSKFINVTNQSADSWLYLNITYLENEIIGFRENSLAIARYNGSWETNASRFADPAGVYAARNYVFANITNFSSGRIFAPMGIAPNDTCIAQSGSYCGYREFCNANLINSSDSYFCCSQSCTKLKRNPKRIYHWPYLVFTKYRSFNFSERLDGDIAKKRAFYFGNVLGTDGVFVTARGLPNLVEGNWFEPLYTNDGEKENISRIFANFQNNYSKYGIYDNTMHMHAHNSLVHSTQNVTIWRADIITSVRQRAELLKAVGMKKLFLDHEFSNPAVMNFSNDSWYALGKDVMGNATEVYPDIELWLYPGLQTYYDAIQNNNLPTNASIIRYLLYKGLYDNKGTGQIGFFEAWTYGSCDSCIRENGSGYIWDIDENIRNSNNMYAALLGPGVELMVAKWDFEGYTVPAVAHVQNKLRFPELSQPLFQRTLQVIYSKENDYASWDDIDLWDDDNSFFSNFTLSQYDGWLTDLSTVELRSGYSRDLRTQQTHWTRIPAQTSLTEKLTYFEASNQSGTVHVRGKFMPDFPEYVYLEKLAAGKECNGRPLYSQEEITWANEYKQAGFFPREEVVQIAGYSSYSGLIKNFCEKTKTIPLPRDGASYSSPFNVNFNENFILNITISAPAQNNITQITIKNFARFAINTTSNLTSFATNRSNFVSVGNVIHWYNLTSVPLITNSTNQSFYIMMNSTRIGSSNELVFQVCLYNNTDITRACENDSFIVGSFIKNISVNFVFSGFVRIENGSLQPNTNVSIYEYVQNENGPSTEVYLSSVLADSNGMFRFNNINGSKQFYKLKMFYNNGSATTHVGNNLPPMPSIMFYQSANFQDAFFKRQPNLNGTTFYLQPAATLNISARGNLTGSVLLKFGYEIIDSISGFPIESNIRASVFSRQAIVPIDRAYTVMVLRDSIIFPNNATCTANGVMTADACPSPPTSLTVPIANLSIGSLINVELNLSTRINDVTGCISLYGNSSKINVTNVKIRIMPSSGFLPPIDAIVSTFNITNGSNNIIYNDARCPANLSWYNVSLIGSSSGISYMLEFYGKNSSDEAGHPGSAVNLAAFQNITLYDSPLSRNITLRPLVSTYSIVGGGLNTSKLRINIQNSSGERITTNMHVKLQVKNNVFGTINYIIEDLSEGTAYLTLLNNSNWARISIFPQEAPPIERALNLSSAENNITITSTGSNFRRINRSGGLEEINVSDNSQKINITFYKNADGCNLPQPPETCILTQMDAQNFNPMSLMIAGKVNMEMKYSATGATLYFVGFDLFAAKPPTNSVLNGNASQANANSQTQIWDAGSFVPVVYTTAYVGLPYNTTSTAADYINESYRFNISLPYLKDEDWAVVWNRSAGDTLSTLPDEYVEYNTNKYSSLLSSTGVNCSTSNASEVCYMNQSDNKFWVNVPHFSGGGFGINGGADTNQGSDDGGGGGNGGGGGGGGGGSASASISVSQIFTVITADIPVTMIISSPNARGIVNKISFISSETIENVKISFSKLLSMPHFGIISPTREYYSSFQIEAPKLAGKLKEAKIYFEVNKSWLTDKKLPAENVILERFSVFWWDLDTKKIREDDTKVYYEARTTRFSDFRISALKPTTEIIPAEVRPLKEELVGLLQTPITKLREISSKTKSYTWKLGLAIIILLMTIILLDLLKLYIEKRILPKK